jgi:hypothetical protein
VTTHLRWYQRNGTKWAQNESPSTSWVRSPHHPRDLLPLLQRTYSQWCHSKSYVTSWIAEFPSAGLESSCLYSWSAVRNRIPSPWHLTHTHCCFAAPKTNELTRELLNSAQKTEKGYTECREEGRMKSGSGSKHRTSSRGFSLHYRCNWHETMKPRYFGFGSSTRSARAR